MSHVPSVSDSDKPIELPTDTAPSTAEAPPASTDPQLTPSASPEVEALIAAIRQGIAADPSDETARAAARNACQVITMALGGAPGQPLASAVAAEPAPFPVASVVDTLRKLSPDQLLDLAIQRLRAALPAGAEVPAPAPLHFHLVPIAGRR